MKNIYIINEVFIMHDITPATHTHIQVHAGTRVNVCINICVCVCVAHALHAFEVSVLIVSGNSVFC